MFTHKVYTTAEVEFKGCLLSLAVWGDYSYDKGSRYEPPSEEMILSEIEAIVFDQTRKTFKHKTISKRLYAALAEEFGDYLEECLLDALQDS